MLPTSGNLIIRITDSSVKKEKFQTSKNYDLLEATDEMSRWLLGFDLWGDKLLCHSL